MLVLLIGFSCLFAVIAVNAALSHDRVPGANQPLIQFPTRQERLVIGTTLRMAIPSKIKNGEVWVDGKPVMTLTISDEILEEGISFVEVNFAGLTPGIHEVTLTARNKQGDEVAETVGVDLDPAELTRLAWKFLKEKSPGVVKRIPDRLIPIHVIVHKLFSDEEWVRIKSAVERISRLTGIPAIVIRGTTDEIIATCVGGLRRRLEALLPATYIQPRNPCVGPGFLGQAYAYSLSTTDRETTHAIIDVVSDIPEKVYAHEFCHLLYCGGRKNNGHVEDPFLMNRIPGGYLLPPIQMEAVRIYHALQPGDYILPPSDSRLFMRLDPNGNPTYFP